MTDNNTNKAAYDTYNNMANSASVDDIKKIDSKLGGMKKGALKDVWDNVISLWNLIKDPDAAWGAKALAIGALMYVVSPIDAIPDFIPFLGLTDDVVIVLSAVASLKNALDKYKSASK